MTFDTIEAWITECAARILAGHSLISRDSSEAWGFLDRDTQEHLACLRTTVEVQLPLAGLYERWLYSIHRTPETFLEALQSDQDIMFDYAWTPYGCDLPDGSGIRGGGWNHLEGLTARLAALENPEPDN